MLGSIKKRSEVILKMIYWLTMLKLLVSWLILVAMHGVCAAAVDVGWCLPTDFTGVISAEQILSMTLDLEYDPADQSTLYLVGGLANQGGANNVAFFYSFKDGGSEGECGLRHSYKIEIMNLGIQGVTISETQIWGIGLPQGQDSLGLADSDNLIIRTSKEDPNDVLTFYRVDFKGTEAGSVPQRQTVLKMTNFNDDQIVVQSEKEVRFMNVAKNKVHGLYTLDQGNVFQQRDIFVAKNGSPSQRSWNTYLAYPKYDFDREALLVVIDRVTVDSSLNLSNQFNIFHGLSQNNYKSKEFKTVQFAVDEAAETISICIQVTYSPSPQVTQSGNIFTQISLKGDLSSVRPVEVNSVKSPDGQEFECMATSINDGGDTAYYLLGDQLNYKHTVFTYDIAANQLSIASQVEQPYRIVFSDNVYAGKRAVFTHDHNFAYVNIDDTLYGKFMRSGFQLGYIVDSRDEKRINRYMDTTKVPLETELKASILANPYPKSFLILDSELEGQKTPMLSNRGLSGVTNDDTSFKTPWMDYFCQQSGEIGQKRNIGAKIDKEFTLQFSDKVSTMTNFDSTCYPSLNVRLPEPLLKDTVRKSQLDAPYPFTVEVLITNIELLGESLAIANGPVGDAYHFNSSLKDPTFEVGYYFVLVENQGNILPVFLQTDTFPSLSVLSQAAFSQDIPEIFDPEIPDQTVTVSLDTGEETWLLLSEDQSRLYVEAGPSTLDKEGQYQFEIILNDGYRFGPNETRYSFSVTISEAPRGNELPYFAQPGLQPQTFVAEQAFQYKLPAFIDADGDPVSLEVDNTETPWLQLSLDQKSLFVKLGAAQGIEAIGTFDISLILDDNNPVGFIGISRFTLQLTVTEPVNSYLPRFVGADFQTKFTVPAESAWSYELPRIVSDDVDDIVTVYLENIETIPGIQVNNSTRSLYIEKGAVMGKQTLGLHTFSVVLDDGWVYSTDSKVVYPMQIEITVPANVPPKFLNDSPLLDGDQFAVIVGNSLSLRLADVVDEDTQSEKITITLISPEAPWLTQNSEQGTLRISSSDIDASMIGDYPFQIELDDGFDYRQSKVVYSEVFKIVRQNSLPNFATALALGDTFKAERAWEYKLPDLVDADGDQVSLSFEKIKFPWLEYDKESNKIFVREKRLRDKDVGDYTVGLTLTDGFPYGPNESLYFFKIKIEPAVREFIVSKPKNKAPNFFEELTQVEQQFNVGQLWEFALPKIVDSDNDPVIVTITSIEETPFVKANSTHLFIKEGTTDIQNVQRYKVLIELTDDPIEGADPLSSSHELKIFGVDPATLKKLARLVPLPPQTGTVPVPRIKDITSTGQVTVTFDKAIGFPADMVQKVNSYTEAIVISPGKPYVPKFNNLGFQEVPYVRSKIFVVDNKAENVAYTWKMTDFSSTSMTFQFTFKNALTVSRGEQPDTLELEFHIQEFLDANGKGVRDNHLTSKLIPLQIKNDLASETLQQTGESVKESANALLYTQFAINFLLNSAMEKLWIMVNGLQFIVVIPLIPLTFPPNAGLILGGLVNVANFDLIPGDLIWPFIFDFKESEPFNFEFSQAGYESGYLAENMATVFVLTHFIVFLLLVTLVSYTQRNRRFGNKFYSTLAGRLIWNPIIIFFMEGYIEILLCAYSVIKRWDWDVSRGDFNINSNMIYGIAFMVICSLLPLFLFIFYCKNKALLNKKGFSDLYGGPYVGLKHHHKNISILYVTNFFLRRLFVVITICIFEQNLIVALLVQLLPPLAAAGFIWGQQPFIKPQRNRLELFNECITIVMVIFTFCFTPVMEPESQETIGLVFIWLLILFLFVHVSSLLSDSVRKICLYIWLKLNSCACGKALQKNIKRRIIKRRRRKNKKAVKRPRAPPIVVEEVESSESEGAEPAESSLELEDYEAIVEQYKATKKSQQKDVNEKVTIANNLLVIERRNKEIDPIDQEMQFWMDQIEQFEGKGSVTQRARHHQPEPIDDSQVNDLEAIFVPEDWMIGQELNDDAFDDVVQVNALDDKEPIEVKKRRRNPSQDYSSPRTTRSRIIPPPTQDIISESRTASRCDEPSQLLDETQRSSAKPNDLDDLLDM